MNKAFCREPEETRPPACPVCGNEGLRVEGATLAAHVPAPHVEALGEPAYFCDTARCDVAYFDTGERLVHVGEAHGLPWPKDPTGPLCGCHGFTIDDVDADIAEGLPTRVREAVRRAGLPDAACGTRSADGRSCAARIQRLYVRRSAGREGA